MAVGELRNSDVEFVADFHSTPRLGESLHSTGIIGAASVSRCVQSMHEFREHASKLHVEKILAVGTSALRNATNRGTVLPILESALGAPIEIISGQREAMLTLCGVVGVNRHGSVIDIGGGSTEIVSGSLDRHSAVSLELGSVLLTDEYIAGGHRTETGVKEKLLEFVSQQVVNSEALSLDVGMKVFAVAGTPVSLAMLELGMQVFDEKAIHGFELSLTAAEKWSDYLFSITEAELKRLPGIDRGRIDILPVGTAILIGVMRSMLLNSILVSTKGLRHGLINNYLFKAIR
ncbi:MAG: hypothetical protein HQ472_07855 [Ignavibacteria bacterium]|nr:hypothetical protein [Ignavibacteria bacterium]